MNNSTETHANPIDAFLYRHRDEIAAPYRTMLRDQAAKAINGREGHEINMNHCPSDLRSELLDIIVSEAEKRRERIAQEYIRKSQGKKFEVPKQPASWL